jgi:NAD(P)-dependent dehydrogenase (short-subunit alcohol dehydrogenase family)
MVLRPNELAVPVAGGSVGIGRGIAKAPAADGTRVAVTARRVGRPEAIASLVCVLASPRGGCGCITGTVIPVDGGLRRYQF